MPRKDLGKLDLPFKNKWSKKDLMSLRYYDILEKMLQDLEKWDENQAMDKRDVIESSRERVIMLMRHVITTPMIGTAYAYPGDLDLNGLLSMPE